MRSVLPQKIIVTKEGTNTSVCGGVRSFVRIASVSREEESAGGPPLTKEASREGSGHGAEATRDSSAKPCQGQIHKETAAGG